MATHKSAEKRNRQNIVRRERNRSNRAEAKTAVQSARKKVDAKDKGSDLKALVAKAASTLAKTAHKGSIHWKTAARKTGRLQRALNKAMFTK